MTVTRFQSFFFFFCTMSVFLIMGTVVSGDGFVKGIINQWINELVKVFEFIQWNAISNRIISLQCSIIWINILALYTLWLVIIICLNIIIILISLFIDANTKIPKHYKHPQTTNRTNIYNDLVLPTFLTEPELHAYRQLPWNSYAIS